MNIDFSKVEVVAIRGYCVYRYTNEGQHLYMNTDGVFISDLDKAKQINVIEQEIYPGTIQHFLDETIYDIHQFTMDDIILRCFLELCLLPAIKTIHYDMLLERMHITCEYKGSRYRVVGASTMGDLWLNKNPNCTLENGYTNRVAIQECSNYQAILK